MEIRKVGLIGAGQMGNGIAQVCAASGFEVRMHDLSVERINAGLATINGNLSRLIAKGSMDEAARQSQLSLIHAAPNLEDLDDCDIIIEAATENESVKKQIFINLCKVIGKKAVIASNTSSISITRLASVTDRPERFIGIHFMNPVPMKPTVEVIRGFHTSDQTIAITEDLLSRMGKEGILVNDLPGFVSNRVLMLTINEAVFVLQDQVASAKQVDDIFKKCFGHKMGPLETADLIGLDTVLAIINVLYDGFKDPKFRPCPLLVKMVNAGYLGKKSGRGFYQY